MLDHSFVRAASRRAGQTFTFVEKRKPIPNGRQNAKLTPADVGRIRVWAGREGWGLSHREQARALKASVYPHVSAQALCDVLRNQSWYEPAYDPGQPDAEFWKDVGTIRILLGLLTRAT